VFEEQRQILEIKGVVHGVVRDVLVFRQSKTLPQHTSLAEVRLVLEMRHFRERARERRRERRRPVFAAVVDEQDLERPDHPPE